MRPPVALPSRGRTCSRPDALREGLRGLGDSLHADGQLDDEVLVDAACAAGAHRPVAACHQVGDLQVALVRHGIDAPEEELLEAVGEGPIGTRDPVGHNTVDDPPVRRKTHRSCPALVAGHLAGALDRTHTTRRDGPRLNHRLLVDEDVIGFTPVLQLAAVGAAAGATGRKWARLCAELDRTVALIESYRS